MNVYGGLGDEIEQPSLHLQGYTGPALLPPLMRSSVPDHRPQSSTLDQTMTKAKNDP